MILCVLLKFHFFLLIPSVVPTTLKSELAAKSWTEAREKPAACTAVVLARNVVAVSVAAIDNGTVTGDAPTWSVDDVGVILRSITFR